MSEHEQWCPHFREVQPGPVPCTCASPPLSVVLAAISDLSVKVERLDAKFDKAAGQIDAVAEMAGPAIAQISSSPLLKMLGGKKS